VGVQLAPATQASQLPAASHTRFVPQLVPAGRCDPVSLQACVPVPEEQVVSPASQGFAGGHAIPGLQVTQPPEPLPGERGVPVSVQVGAPVLQEVMPSSHGFAGTQEAPAAQALQFPAPSHTRFVPQLAPAGRSVPVSVHVSAPVAQELRPASQGLVGAQERLAVHALQVPVLLHTSFVPQASPTDKATPVSLHVCAPVAQEVTPTSQASVGLQESPAVQATQVPPLQTRFVPQLVPSGTLPVLEQVEAPDEHETAEVWHGFVEVQLAPQRRKSQVAEIVPMLSGEAVQSMV
jgi:hypothetical protein